MGGRLAAGERPLTARYALDEVLARGGVGEVWRARDLRLGRPVAVKVLHGAQADPNLRTRFRNEAQHAARLSHPNIAAVFDYGEETAEDGDEPTPFLVMELVEGESLADLLARRGRLGVGRTLSILRQLSCALAAAHEAGVVHRDVKPANVLVRPDGVVKITDFGIAASAASAALTETGQVVGTARYLSPEQARGKRGTPASDVYALGLVGYECLAGRPAFDGPDPVQVAAKQVFEPPPPLPPDVPEQVCGLVRTATAKDPARRLPDGAALRDALDRLLDNGRRAARSAVPPRGGASAVGSALGAGALDGTTVKTSGPVPVPVPAPARSRAVNAAAEVPGSRRRRRWWPLAVGGALLCALAAVLLVIGHSGAAGSPATVRAGVRAGTTGTSSGGAGGRRGATAPGPSTVSVPAAPTGAADTGGATPAPEAVAGRTVAAGVRGATGGGAPEARTTTTGAGAGTGSSTGAPTATTGTPAGGATGAATGSTAPGASSSTGGTGATDGTGSTGSTSNDSPGTGSAGTGSTATGSTDPVTGSTDPVTGGDGSTAGSTAGPTDGGETDTSGTDTSGTGTPGAGSSGDSTSTPGA